MGDKIIGVFGLFSSLLKVKDQTVLCNTGVDVGIHPDYRGRGIYSSIRDYANEVRVEEGYGFSYGIESNPVLIKAHEARGDQNSFPFTVRQDFKIIDINKHFEKNKSNYVWIKKIGFYFLKRITLLNNRFRKIREISQVELVDFCDDSLISKFLSNINSEHDFIFLRSLEYFRWRYLDARGGSYFIKYAIKNGRLIGFIVLSMKSSQDVEDYPLGYIVELVTLNEFSWVEYRLIEEAIDYFRKSGVNFIRFLTVSGKKIERLLKGYMFLNGDPLYLTFTVGLNREDILKWQPFVLDRIHFCYGDIDYI
jgi:GNAT superfamily N-acetyltransferase